VAELMENTLHPLQIADSRDAQHKASELQRDLADDLAKKHKEVAAAEFRYRVALTARIKQLHHDEGMAITMCETVAKGEESIATLRRERDNLRGDLASLEQNGFRMGADRRALDGMPAEGSVESIGGRRAA
jgi:hypothetical protein